MTTLARPSYPFGIPFTSLDLFYFHSFLFRLPMLLLIHPFIPPFNRPGHTHLRSDYKSSIIGLQYGPLTQTPYIDSQRRQTIDSATLFRNREGLGTRSIITCAWKRTVRHGSERRVLFALSCQQRQKSGARACISYLTWTHLSGFLLPDFFPCLFNFNLPPASYLPHPTDTHRCADVVL